MSTTERSKLLLFWTQSFMVINYKKSKYRFQSKTLQYVSVIQLLSSTFACLILFRSFLFVFLSLSKICLYIQTKPTTIITTSHIYQLDKISDR